MNPYLTISIRRILQSGMLLIVLQPQADAATYSSGPLDFAYSGHNLWNSPGTAVHSEQFIGLSLPLEVIGIDAMVGSKKLGTRSGFSLNGLIGPGKVGENIGIDIDPGDVKVKYPLAINLDLPNAAVQAGSAINFGGHYSIAKTPLLSTAFSQLSGSVAGIFNVPALLVGEACIFNKCSGDVANVSITTNPVEVFSFNQNGNGKLQIFDTNQVINFGNEFPIIADYDPIPGIGIGTKLGGVTIYTPSIATQSSTPLPNGVLFSHGSSQIFDLSLDLATLVNAALDLPPPNITAHIGPIDASLSAYSANAQFQLGLEQTFSFDPTPMIRLAFDRPVSIVDSSAANGIAAKLTTDQYSLNLEDLAKVEFKFSEDTKVTPTFTLKNAFRNLTELKLDFSMLFKMLEAKVSFQNLEYGFDGFAKQVGNADLGEWTLFDESFSLNMGSFSGQSFVIDVAGNNRLPAVWQGLTSNHLMSDAGNWENQRKLSDGEALVIKNQGQLSQIQNDYLKQLDGITFVENGSGVTLQGIAVGNGGGIVNQSAVLQTVALEQTLTANQQWVGGDAGLKVTGKLDLADHSLWLRHTQLEQTNPLTVGKTGLADLLLSENSSLRGDSLKLGEKAGGSGKLSVQDGSVVELGRDLSAGPGGASLNVDSGGKISVGNQLQLGNAAGVETQIRIQAKNSQVDVAGATHLGDAGRVYLDAINGGRLNTAEIFLSQGSGGRVDANINGAGSAWNVSGHLNADGNGNATIKVANGGALTVGSASNLKNARLGSGQGQTLLEIGDGGQVNIHGDLAVGGHGDVRLNGGALMAWKVTDGGLPVLAGNDRTRLTVDGATQIAAGGNLSLDNAKPIFGGGLNVAGHLSSSRDSAIQGNMALTGQGTVAVNDGTLSLNGDLDHNGADFQVADGATATLLGEVRGAGSFSGGGHVNFAGDFLPGNSPAAIDFGGDDVSFLAGSVLTLEIFGNTPGSQFDQLVGIDHLDFFGDLHLIFAENFNPEIGSSLDLFRFNSFSGRFDPGHILVSGLHDKSLDFSQLALNGSLSFAAVPLPPAAWLFGTALLAWRLPTRRSGLSAVRQ
ncbi:MAG: hypothetical protein PHH11_10175 [Methylomonas sp.]|nr:hypothetical protein [Methylomonas sp.]